jgi:hypothetical protein
MSRHEHGVAVAVAVAFVVRVAVMGAGVVAAAVAEAVMVVLQEHQPMIFPMLNHHHIGGRLLQLFMPTAGRYSTTGGRGYTMSFTSDRRHSFTQPVPDDIHSSSRTTTRA